MEIWFLKGFDLVILIISCLSVFGFAVFPRLISGFWLRYYSGAGDVLERVKIKFFEEGRELSVALLHQNQPL